MPVMFYCVLVDTLLLTGTPCSVLPSHPTTTARLQPCFSTKSMGCSICSSARKNEPKLTEFCSEQGTLVDDGADVV